MGTNGSLHEAGDGCWAYVQRDGSWGWSNAGAHRSPDVIEQFRRMAALDAPG